MQWNADDNIADAAKESFAAQGSLPDVGLFAWWCNSGGTSNVAGRAYLGTLCNKKGMATSINEYQGSAAFGGYVRF